MNNTQTMKDTHLMKSPELTIVEARIAMIEKILGTSFDQGLKDELEMRKVQLESMKFMENNPGGFKMMRKLKENMDNHIEIRGCVHTKCKPHKCDAYLNGDCNPERVVEE